MKVLFYSFDQVNTYLSFSLVYSKTEQVLYSTRNHNSGTLLLLTQPVPDTNYYNAQQSFLQEEAVAVSMLDRQNKIIITLVILSLRHIMSGKAHTSGHSVIISPRNIMSGTAQFVNSIFTVVCTVACHLLRP